MPQILLALGSNVADAAASVRLGWAAACQELGLRDAELSDLVRSPPAEGASGGLFANAVGRGWTELTPLLALAACQRIEQAFGRDRAREGHHGARPLDLDLLDWDGLHIDLPQLQLPHPRLSLRRFVLEPLAQVAPDFVDARSGRTVAELIATLQDV
jgi:2-amino-4-hydroxy-6-hydroxymethyldihydropteridine diphosphokinase